MDKPTRRDAYASHEKKRCLRDLENWKKRVN